MKKMHYAYYLSALLLVVTVAQAKNEIDYTVPFHNAQIKPASKIYVKYSFDSHHQTLVCTSPQSNDAITTVGWHYKGVGRKIDLPVTLKDDQRFEGNFANPSGVLTITNEFGGSEGDGSIVASCEYKEMK